MPDLEETAKTANNLRTIWGVATGFLVAAFLAGITYNNLRNQLSSGIADIATLQEEVRKLKLSDNVTEDEFTQRSAEIRNNIANNGTELVEGGQAGGSTGLNQDALCPPGTYLAGIRSWGADSSVRYCIACLTQIQPLCRVFGTAR